MILIICKIIKSLIKKTQMTAQTLTATTCTATEGDGLVTTWLLSGSTSTYVAATGVSADTDGYKIDAKLTWKLLVALTGTTIAKSEETPVVDGTTPVVIGTCVETLTSSGTALTSTDTTMGCAAVCHFMYAKYGTDEGITTNSGTTNAWGDTKYLT
jgi:hypothetical protein